MTSEAQLRAEEKRTPHRVHVSFAVNRKKHPERAAKLEALKQSPDFHDSFAAWIDSYPQ